MADHTITVSNTLRIFEPIATVWGSSGQTTMTWGTDKWGYDSEDAIHTVTKLFDDTLSLASDITSSDLDRALSNELAFTSDVTVEYLTSGVWYYIFPGGVTNAEERITTSWGTATAQSSSYSTPSTPNTTWSAA